MRERVLNLDGRVNSEALTIGEGSAEKLAYLRRRGIRWFADRDDFVAVFLGGDPARNGWEQVDRRREMGLYRYTGKIADAPAGAGQPR